MVAKKCIFLGCLVFFILNLSFVCALRVDISVDESSTLIKLNAGGYSLNAQGTLTLYNPSNVSKIYEVNLPIELDSFIGFSKIDVHESVPILNSSNVTVGYYNITSDKFNFAYDKIRAYFIEPNETVKVGYNIYGLLDYNIYDKMNSSVFDYYVKSYDLLSRVNLNLEKPQREGFVYYYNGTLNSSPSNATSRAISCEVYNPTDFEYFVREVKLYKTNVSDPYYDDGDVISSFGNVSVLPYQKKTFDFLDYSSMDNNVYWMSTNVFLIYNLTSSVKKNFIIEPTPVIKSKKSGGSGFHSLKINDTPIDYSVVIRKDTNKTLIRNGEEFEVVLRIVNPNNVSLENFTLYDEVPDGYEIKEVSDDVKIQNRKLTFRINEVDDYSTYVVSYVLVAKTSLKGVTYLKPARLVWGDKEFFSEGVLLINDLLVNQKVFVQKEVSYVSDEYAKVSITVKNLGNYYLEDILINDEIPEDAIIKDISQFFYERGTWKIKALNPGEEWEVSYLISRDAQLDTFPNVFGVNSEDVFSTLVFSEEVVTSFKEEPKIYEKLGLGLAVGILVVYLLF